MAFQWGDDRRFYSYNRYLEKTFGERLQKIPLDAGFSCPNRDGTVGTGGCTYCVNAAFNPPYCQASKSISTQLDDGIRFFAKQRSIADQYLAYFQSFSNTHAPVEIMQQRYAEALDHPAVRGIVIATRPDCLDRRKLDMLANMQEHHYIALEIGIESMHNATLQRIHRGHTMECTLQALQLMEQYRIPLCCHLIFGLPGESPDTWMSDLQLLNTLKINSLKFHQLQIIHNTVMEQDFNEHPEDFHTFSFDDYVAFIVEYLAHLRPDIAVERLAGEVPPAFLSVQQWKGKRYYELVAAVETEMRNRNLWQGAKNVPAKD